MSASKTQKLLSTSRPPAPAAEAPASGGMAQVRDRIAATLGQANARCQGGADAEQLLNSRNQGPGQ